MPNEDQYYGAKIMLKSYKQALKTLDMINEEQNKVSMIDAYQKNLINCLKKGQIHIKDGIIQKGKNFQNSKISKLGDYNKNKFREYFGRFQSIKTVQQMMQILEHQK